MYQADVGRIWNFSFYLLIVIWTCDLAYLLTCWSDVFQDLMEFSNFTCLSLLLNCIIALASFVPHVLCRHSSFNQSFFMFWLNLAHVTIAVSTSSSFFFFFFFGGWWSVGLIYDVWCHFQQYFSYIVVVSFIGGGNARKPPTCDKSLTNFITYCWIGYTSPEWVTWWVMIGRGNLG